MGILDHTDDPIFDKWCESVKDCGHPVQPNSATARQRKLGWDAAMATIQASYGQAFLRRIVDLAWNSATDSDDVPHTTHADELIEKAKSNDAEDRKS